MAGDVTPDAEAEESRRVVGACVLIALGAVVIAVVFAVSRTAGVLALWVVGTVALWRSARRMSVSSATPPPRGVAADSDIDARRRRAQARGVYDPNGVMYIVHPPADSDPGEVNER